MIKYGGLISSDGVGGWYETTQTDEVIIFSNSITALLVEALDTPLAIHINGDKDNSKDVDLWHIDGGGKEGIEGVKIYSMVVKGEAGQKIRWKGLVA